MHAIHQIIVPVDLEEHTEKIIEYAAYMANKLSANLTIVHVIEPFPTVGDMDMGLTALENYRENRLKHATEFLEKTAASYPNSRTAVIQGEIVDEIVEFTRKQNGDLIIIGTHGSKGIEKLLLGSVAERVVKNAHCPTLVMNPFKQ